jgi:hypothetical protein
MNQSHTPEVPRWQDTRSWNRRMLGAFAVLLCVCATPALARSSDRVLAVKVPGDRTGPIEASIVADQLWVAPLLSTSGSNLFRIDAATLEAHNVPAAAGVQYVRGDSQRVWTMGTDIATGAPMFSTFRLGDTDPAAQRRAPQACAAFGAGSLVFQGRLWIDCLTTVVALGPGSQSRPTVRRLRNNIRGLLAAAGAVWVATDRNVMTLGDQRPIRIAFPQGFLPFISGAGDPAWTSNSTHAWALGVNANNRKTVIAVDFQHRSARVLDIAVAKGSDSIARVGRELWLTDAANNKVDRYALPTRKRLPSFQLPVNRQQIRGPRTFSLHPGKRFMWVVVNSAVAAQVFRVRLQ